MPKENRQLRKRLKKYGKPARRCREQQDAATYLSVVQCMPYERLQSLSATMFNVRISQGTPVNIVREMLYKSRPATDLIERLIMLRSRCSALN